MTAPKVNDLIEALDMFAPHDPFIEHNLFEPPPSWNPVQVHREQMVDFRNNYRLISEFAAFVCGVPLNTFCKMDMISFINRRAEEGKRER